jgi:hypothetical protein
MAANSSIEWAVAVFVISDASKVARWEIKGQQLRVKEFVQFQE